MESFSLLQHQVEFLFDFTETNPKDIARRDSSKFFVEFFLNTPRRQTEEIVSSIMIFHRLVAKFRGAEKTWEPWAD